eukprot:Selendium_serpulae@DN5480_c0_g1_i2.p1
MDMNAFFSGLWEAMSCNGVSCFERTPPVVDQTDKPDFTKERLRKDFAECDSEWSDDGGEPTLSSALTTARMKMSPLEKHRRRLNRRVKVLPTDVRCTLRISEDGKTLTWSTQSSPRTYSGLLGGISVDDISEVKIVPTNDRVVLISAFEESWNADETDCTVKTFTVSFKFRSSVSLMQWVADLDKFLEEFCPPEEKQILDYSDTTGRMSGILNSRNMRDGP